jgi:hypothetical protein
MEIMKALKAEEKALEKRFRAIQIALKAMFDEFRKQQKKRSSAKKKTLKVASRRRSGKNQRARSAEKKTRRLSEA